jgi:hypothetical protein
MWDDSATRRSNAPVELRARVLGGGFTARSEDKRRVPNRSAGDRPDSLRRPYRRRNVLFGSVTLAAAALSRASRRGRKKVRWLEVSCAKMLQFRKERCNFQKAR